jgi:hypothetical protein
MRTNPIVGCLLAACLLQGCSTQTTGSSGTTPSSTAPTQQVTISGTHFLRDGQVWAPHGLASVAFNASPGTRSGLFGTAFNDFNATEVAAMKAWGNDTIRLFAAQPALDSNDPSGLYDPTYLGQYVAAVKALRAVGLNVIVVVQDEAGTGEQTPTALPNGGTGDAWQVLAPALAGDNGILFEIMNEPQPAANAANWAAWATAMNSMVTIIRNAGAKNVLIADGLQFAEQLDGAPTLADPLNQVAYAAHPYAHSAADQTQAGNGQPGVGWDAKFGNVSVTSTNPVLVSEWSLENDVDAPAPNNTFQYCDANSNQAALNMLNYLQSKGIGLISIAYDLPNQPAVPRVGRVGIDEQATPTTLVNTGCGDATFGPGTIIQNWYQTGVVPTSLQ